MLALDEPYRGVVIAIYYQGRTPQALAIERGVAPGTVRAQLSRGLTQLRGRLDRDHGPRAVWSAVLATWVRDRSAALLPSGSIALPTAPLAATLVGVAALGAVVIAGWLVFSGSSNGSQGELALARPAPEGGSTPLAPTPAAAAGDREALVQQDTASAANIVTAIPASPIDELPAMLVRMRQIKSLLLARALEPQAEVLRELRWLLELPQAGVARMLNRDRFGFETDLPWLRGGGAYWSFTNRTHDYQSQPQIGLQKGVREIASGFSGRADGLVLDLGQGIPFDLFLRDPEAVASLLDPKRLEAWELLWRKVEVDDAFDPHSLVAELRRIGFDDDADVEEGHSYLVRAISPGEFDVVAGLQVARSDTNSITFGWRLFESRTVPNAREAKPPTESKDSLPEPPVELATMDDAMLEAELGTLRERGTHLLFRAVPSEIASRADALAGRSDAGLVRLLDGAKPYTEFRPVRSGGQFYSFATRSHDYDEHPDLALESGFYQSGFYGGAAGWLLDLGDHPIDAVERLRVETDLWAAWDFLWNREILVDATREASDLLNEAQVVASAAGLKSRLPAAVGRTYLVRSSLSRHHDHLVGVRPLVVDTYGHFIEWRVLKTWPTPSARR